MRGWTRAQLAGGLRPAPVPGSGCAPESAGGMGAYIQVAIKAARPPISWFDPSGWGGGQF